MLFAVGLFLGVVFFVHWNLTSDDPGIEGLGSAILGLFILAGSASASFAGLCTGLIAWWKSGAKDQRSCLVATGLNFFALAALGIGVTLLSH